MSSVHEHSYMCDGSDGSDVELELNGNTNSSSSTAPSKKGKRDAAKVFWLLTASFKAPGSDGSNNSILTAGEIRRWVEMHCRNAVWQLEKGNETGYVHWQISIRLNKKERFEWFKHHFIKDANIQVARNIRAVNDYCSKDETRLDGPYYHPEQVKRVKDPFLNLKPYAWQVEVMAILAREPDPRVIHWRWSPEGNTGKTVFARHLALTRDAFYGNGASKDIFYAYKGQKIVLINIPKEKSGFISYGAIESLKDAIFFSGKFHSETKIFDTPHIFVFANVPPDTTHMSIDRWSDIVEVKAEY